LAKTYHQLPSVVLREATTFDIMVTDVYNAWEHFKQNPDDNDQYDIEQLKAFKKEL
jgi:hypothetical protein